jgi:hypothetical protein
MLVNLCCSSPLCISEPDQSRVTVHESGEVTDASLAAWIMNSLGAMANARSRMMKDLSVERLEC